MYVWSLSRNWCGNFANEKLSCTRRYARTSVQDRQVVRPANSTLNWIDRKDELSYKLLTDEPVSQFFPHVPWSELCIAIRQPSNPSRPERSSWKNCEWKLSTFEVSSFSTILPLSVRGKDRRWQNDEWNLTFGKVSSRKALSPSPYSRSYVSLNSVITVPKSCAC